MERARLHSRVRRVEPEHAALDALEAAAAPRAYVDDVHAVVATGAVAHVLCEGPDRFADARAQAEALFAGATVDGDAPDGVAPRLVGGFGFEDRAAGGPWDGFSALRFWLPARQLHWTGDGVYEVVNDLDAPGARTPEPPDPRPPEPADVACLDRAGWDAAVGEVLEEVRTGTASKVVLSRVRRAPPADPVAALRALHRVEPGATGFLLDLGAAAFYGATPERLAVREGDTVETHALAGSAPSGDGVEALLRSPKDILEHELVTTYIRGRLEGLGAADVRQERRRLLGLRDVHHIETPITGRTDKHVLDVAAALHPTPAVCGLPPRHSLATIRRLEPAPRGWYAGAVGWFDARGHGRLHVALRCALSTPHATWLHAGAGIIADSDAQSEWEETEHKLASLDAALSEVAP